MTTIYSEESDDEEEDTTIFVIAYINKQYELTQNIDVTQDLSKLAAQFDKNEIDLDTLKEEIPHAFRQANWIKSLFKNTQKYTWAIFHYDTQNAITSIENNNDLQMELNGLNDSQYLKLRIVFQHVSEMNEISITAIYNNIKKHITLIRKPPLIDEYKINVLRIRCMEIFAEQKLEEPFDVVTQTAQKIRYDEDITNYLDCYIGNVYILPQDVQMQLKEVAYHNTNNDDHVLKAPKATRFVWFFADKTFEGNYFFHPFGSEEYYPFNIIDKNRHAYLCIYQQTNTNNIKSDFEFNIVSFQFKGSPQQKKTIIRSDGCYPEQIQPTHSWIIPGSESVYFVDFHNWNNSLTKESNYKCIGSSIIEFILNSLGDELATLSALRFIFNTYHFLTRRGSLNGYLLRKSSVRNIFSTHLTTCYNKVKNVKSWNEVSTMLLCLGVLWALETKQTTKYVTGIQMTETYKHLCCTKRGTTDDILDNVKHTFGEYVTWLLDKLTNKILQETQQITKYGYCLWYNLLYCAYGSTKRKDKTKIMQNTTKIIQALHRTSCVRHLFVLAHFDLTFVKYDRPIKIEYYFVTNLLSTNSISAQDLPARVKYDFIIQLLKKL
eukprot:301451_1